MSNKQIAEKPSQSSSHEDMAKEGDSDTENPPEEIDDKYKDYEQVPSSANNHNFKSRKPDYQEDDFSNKISDLLKEKIEADPNTLLYKRLHYQNGQKKASPSVRARFILLLYAYLHKKTHDRALREEALFPYIELGEYIITLFYIENHYYDEKYGVNNPETKGENRNERHNMYKRIKSFVEDRFDPASRKLIFTHIDRLLRLYFKGLKRDKYFLTFQNLTQNTPNLHFIDPETDSFVNVEYFLVLLKRGLRTKYPDLPRENYLRLYLTRSFLINGVFFQTFAELLIDRFESRGTDHSKLIEFSRVYGLAQQLVNDISDYVPESYGFTTSCKLVEDTFSDMRRGLVTLPMLYHLEHTYETNNLTQQHYRSKNHLERLYSQNKAERSQMQEQILREMLEQKSLSQAMSLLSFLPGYTEELLDLHNPVSTDLLDLMDLTKGNKYYQVYNDPQNGAKKI